MPCCELWVLAPKGRVGKEQRVPWDFSAVMGVPRGGGEGSGGEQQDGGTPGGMNSKCSCLQHAEWREQ